MGFSIFYLCCAFKSISHSSGTYMFHTFSKVFRKQWSLMSSTESSCRPSFISIKEVPHKPFSDDSPWSYSPSFPCALSFIKGKTGIFWSFGWWGVNYGLISIQKSKLILWISIFLIFRNPKSIFLMVYDIWIEVKFLLNKKQTKTIKKLVSLIKT